MRERFGLSAAALMREGARTRVTIAAKMGL
jgi:hypothetical protein